MIPRFSVVIPYYEGAPYIEGCVQSVLDQGFSDLEVIIVDDAGADGTGDRLESMLPRDERLRILHREKNGGTLRARRDGVLASRGEYVLLIDQDDRLTEDSLSALNAILSEESVDILQFGVKVIAENASAAGASVGMSGYLTPKADRLFGEDILRVQFAGEGGFDWNVHHKAFRGEMARRAWGMVEDETLALSDDLYVCFILCCCATNYRALNDVFWYEYHLGRGETLSGNYSFRSYERVCDLDARAMRLVTSFVQVHGDEFARNDWTERLSDVRDRLIEHVMNEMADNLSLNERDHAIEVALSVWPADAVAGELWRFVRDRAYALLSANYSRFTLDEDLEVMSAQARRADAFVKGSGSARYRSMKEAACEHVCDLLLPEVGENALESDESAALGTIIKVLGEAEAATQLMRISRDLAYARLSAREPISENDQCVILFRWGENLAHDAGGLGLADYKTYYAQARGHISDLEHLSVWAEGSSPDSPSLVMRSEYEKQNIKIFVTTHKDVDTFHSSILQPVQVGARSPRKRLLWALQDDEGESIADQNAMYCELTTQYWAWKNVSADYYGFCHYRRYFDFAKEEHKENPYGEIMDDRIDWGAQRKYYLDDASIVEAVQGFDVVTTRFNDVSAFPEHASNLREHYHLSPHLNVADLDRIVEILCEEHPDYAEDAQSYLSGCRSCFCNMYIMCRDLFFRYCEWMFPMLERFVSEWNSSNASHEMLRTPGHLSERLFNIFLIHEKRLNPQLRVREVQCVHFERPEHLAEPMIEPCDTHGMPVVPVVLAADDKYVPMATTTIYSMLCNASSDYHYDIVVLEKDISSRNQRSMRDFFSRFPNATIRFVDVGGLIESYSLQTNNEHISIETYYRFLIQGVLPGYDKVLYLDADLIVLGDISELYNYDLGDNLIAAVRDIDYLGNLNMSDGKRMTYTREVLGLEEPYGYFQAGVLLLNTHEMRSLRGLSEWLSIASDSTYIYDDQDILNAECQGRTVYLQDAWNVMIDCDGRFKKVFSFAPARVFDSFMAAYEKPKIIHYAGYEKPWKPGGCDMDDIYWMYARQTPFYERFLGMLYAEQVSVQEDIAQAKEEVIDRLTTPPRAISEDSPLRSMFDGILPSGSRRREIAKSVVRKLRGR